MSKSQYKKVLNEELEALNAKIDLKILWDQGYSDDARRHKMLLAQSRKIKARERADWIRSFFPIFTTR